MGDHKQTPRWRKLRSIATVTLLVGAGLFWIASPASAAACTTVNGFEIDGDMAAGTCGGLDWASPSLSGLIKTSTGGGVYSSSSKDDKNPAGWTSSGQSPDKTSISATYTFAEVDPSNHYDVFLAWERDNNSGTGSYVAEIDNAGVRTSADGTPQPDRSQGGFVFFIDMQGSSAPATGQACSFGPVTYPAGAGNYPGTCKSVTFTSAFNQADFVDPLNNANIPKFQFFEVGLDVTALTGIAPSCPGANADSMYLRSITGGSTALKAYASPIAIAPNSTCVAPTIETVDQPGDATAKGVTGVGAGVPQTDHAIVTGTAAHPAPTGSVKFFLCGPGVSDCSTGGTQVGAAAKLTTHAGNSTADSDPVNDAAHPLDAGTYCWRAEYTPDKTDASNPFLAASHTNSSTECFTVKHASPTISTTISVTGDNTPGSATLSDSATLHGFLGTLDNESIAFHLYDTTLDPGCTGKSVFDSTGSLSAAGTATTSGSYVATSAHTYVWIASYSGDIWNDGALGKCSDGGESDTVGKHQTSVSTTATATGTVGDPISDSVVVSGSGSPTGDVTFTLYGPSAVANCATSIFSSTVTLDANGHATSGSYTPTTAGTYYWIASYLGDASNSASSGSCGDSNEASVLSPHVTTLSTTATSATIGGAISDSAQLTGAVAPTKKMTFNLYGPSATPTCTTPIFTSAADIDANGNAVSGSFTPTAAGSYYWVASYPGDANNAAVTGKCGDSGETSTVSQLVTVVITAATNATVGGTVSDTATLSGAAAPAGTITFNLYGPSATASCTGTPVYTATVSAAGGGPYSSGTFAPSTAGSYYWTAAYSGDANNLPSSEPCGAAGETSVVNPVAPTIATVATSGTVGQAIHDTATLSGATANASGTITFTLYGPNDTSCSGTPVFTSSPIAVTGNGDYGSGNVTPTGAGNYNWVAHYSGDANNLAADEACGAAGETSGLGAAGVSVTPTPTPTPSPSHGVSGQSTGPVAVTGSPLGAEIGWALALLLGGAGLVLIGKRRRGHRAR